MKLMLFAREDDSWLRMLAVGLILVFVGWVGKTTRFDGRAVSGSKTGPRRLPGRLEDRDRITQPKPTVFV